MRRPSLLPPPTAWARGDVAFKYGWALVLLAVFLLSGCADDVHAYAAAQADLADAIADAAKEAGK